MCKTKKTACCKGSAYSVHESDMIRIVWYVFVLIVSMCAIFLYRQKWEKGRIWVKPSTTTSLQQSMTADSGVKAHIMNILINIVCL